MLKLGAITTVFHNQGLSLAEQIQAIHELGADFVDINENPDRLSKADLRAALRYIYRHDVPVYSIFALYDLVLVDPQVQDEVVASICRRLDFAALCGARNLLTGVGRVPACNSRPSGWKAAVEAMRRVAEHAERVGVPIAVELEPFDEALVHDVDTMQRFLAEVDSPFCLANLDIAHCVLRSIPPQAVDPIADRVVHVHLADCDGKVHVESVPGTGVVDFKAYLDPLLAKGWQGGAALEIQPSPNPRELVAQGLEYMRRMYPR